MAFGDRLLADGERRRRPRVVVVLIMAFLAKKVDVFTARDISTF